MKTEFKGLNDIAIMTDSNIAIFRNSGKNEVHKYTIENEFNIMMLIDMCRQHNIYNLWVSPYTEVSNLFVLNFLECSKGYGVKYYKLDNKTNTYICYMRVYKIDGQEDICITLPEFNYLWMFNEYDDISPNDLAIMLVLLRHKLGVAIYNSPTNIGIRLLENLTPNNHQEWLQTSEAVLDDSLPLATNLVWRYHGKPSPKKYLHVYDKEGAYLSSYQSTLLPVKDFKHHTDRPFHKDDRGIWKVKITGESIYNGEELPLPYNPYAYDNWLWTYELKIAEMLGYQITVEECYLWKEVHYVFREWSKFLWDTRQELKQLSSEKNKQGYLMAYNAIKQIYTETGGRLAHRNSLYARKDIYQRKEWYSLIVANTRLQVLLQVDKLVKAGYYPVMIMTDALYYLSDDKNPITAIPSLMNREGLLGGYKHKYSIEYSNVESMFNNDATPNQIAETLNKLHKEKLTW